MVEKEFLCDRRPGAVFILEGALCCEHLDKMGVSWWRMAFIFGPAVARGDISSFGLYTPFIFGEKSP